MSEGCTPNQVDLDQRRLDLERYKAKLDFRKFVLGSVFVALAVAAIPPTFQYATAYLEDVKSDKERQNKQQEFRDGYVKDFLANAVSQDIELRIRFSQYFASVSTEAFRKGWVEYHDALVKQRGDIRNQIDKMEAKWRQAVKAEKPDDQLIDELELHLKWAYDEVGYVEKNRSSVRNPRAASPLPALPSDQSIQPNKYQVFVQFAGVITRDDVRGMMRKLNDVGWMVQGIEGGGERSPAAAGQNEVRYTDSGDAPAAQALAQAVQAFNLVSRRVEARSAAGIPKGNLEVWISR